MYKGVIMALELIEKQFKNDPFIPREYQYYVTQGLNIAKEVIQDTYDESVREIPSETLEDLIQDIITEHGSDLAIESLGYIIEELKEVHEYED